jgi:hypothetical protein
VFEEGGPRRFRCAREGFPFRASSGKRRLDLRGGGSGSGVCWARVGSTNSQNKILFV